ncbi:cation transporter [Shimazuella kribbensis]|uniref:cation transporter n=1 Tax=Shimazuella kribbensis TaxID=139808 RepID=UPI0003F7A7A8|nr:cation transporter [Shimazuella kribbensis]
MSKKELIVNGMGSQHCAMIVKGALKPLATKIEIDLSAKRVTVEYKEGQVSLDTIREAIEEQGYEVV